MPVTSILLRWPCSFLAGAQPTALPQPTSQAFDQGVDLLTHRSGWLAGLLLLLLQVKCTGTESSLAECKHSNATLGQCSSYAWVECVPPTSESRVRSAPTHNKNSTTRKHAVGA